MELGIYQIQKILANLNLNIPEYQRPYKWQAQEHVLQLLKDINRLVDSNVSSYRLGTLILHQANASSKNPRFDIVDGQQRLITLTLMLRNLGEQGLKLLEHKFSDETSVKNIAHNYAYIRSYFSHMEDQRRKHIKSFLLEKCEFAVIPLTSQSEAFQLFDSQNGRGKSLAPSDLLKAYHLRQMGDATAFEQAQRVEKWERAIETGELNELIGDQLFRLRSWGRKEWKYFFRKEDIGTFKGISVNQRLQRGEKYPYLQRAVLQNLSATFHLEEMILNGKRFFDYVEHYRQLLREVKAFVTAHKIPVEYEGAHRIGDQRLKHLYWGILLFYADKFGLNGQASSFTKQLYRWVYLTRLEKKQVRYETIVNKLKNEAPNPIALIQAWYEPDVMAFQESIPYLSPPSIKKDVEAVKKAIKKYEQPENK